MRVECTPSSVRTAAGKTSLFNLLTGFLRPTSGSIVLFGEDATGLPPERIARRGVARSFQITSLFGAAVVLLVRDTLTNVPEASGVVTGAIFVVIVLAFRRGLWPTLADLIRLAKSRAPALKRG
jgi:ABC-type uncharacterized transport system ATPase subunit